MLIDAILFHLADAMRDQGSRLLIIPEVTMHETTFKTKEGRHSFAGVVDYMLIHVKPYNDNFARKWHVRVLVNLLEC